MLLACAGNGLSNGHFHAFRRERRLQPNSFDSGGVRGMFGALAQHPCLRMSENLRSVMLTDLHS